MAVKPTDLLKLKKRLKTFEQQHPKMPAFIKQVEQHALVPGAVVELKVTTPEGKDYVTNIRLTPEDVETFRILNELG